MALTYGFYNSSGGDRVYNATQLSSIFDGVILDGVYASIGNKLMVTEQSGMNLNVGTGRAWFNHTWTLNDALVTVVVPTADALLPRIDIVYLEINEGSGVRANKVDILAGTPASSPVPPTLTNTSTIHQYPLAHINVAALTTSITQANIVNKVGTTETPFVTGPLEFVTVNEILAQWEAEWEEWFDAIKGQLSSEAETNLQNQIWAIVGDINPPLTDLIEVYNHDHSTNYPQIVTAGIAAGAVTSEKLGPGAVTETKLGSGAVTNDKLGSGAVTTGKIAAGTIQGSNIAATTISGSNIVAETITHQKIQNRDRQLFMSVSAMNVYPGTTINWEVTHYWAALSYDVSSDALYGSINIPLDFVGSWEAFLYLSQGDGGNFRPRIDWKSVIDGELLTGSGSYNSITYSGNTGNYLDVLSLGTFPTVAAGDVLYFRITRDIAHAEDTSTANLGIHGILFEYVADS